MTMTKFAKMNAALTAEKFGRLLAVTVDPKNDTVPVLRDFATRIGADPKRWKFLTGEPKAVARVAESFGVLYYPSAGRSFTRRPSRGRSAGPARQHLLRRAVDAESVIEDLQKARKG
jgi:cytochrome oxidase Cu insertion factor (SCO1/SenC/PrrC family)